MCPEGKSLIFFGENFDIVKNKSIRKYRGVDCENCLKQKECTKTKDGIRIVRRDPYDEERNAMDKKMQMPESKEIYKLRKEIVEPVFGDIKENKGKSIMESLNDTSFIAPCGMNCGICRAYLRDKNKCPGCRGVDFHKPVTRVKCKIKNCVIFQASKAKYCFECETFPCDNLKHLDKRYRTKYNMSMIKNLEDIKKFGIRTFLRTEKEKWTCSECGGTICVHKGYCYSCGKKK